MFNFEDYKDIMIADCGTNLATIFLPKKNEVLEVGMNEAINMMLAMPKGSVIVSENAHLGCPRKGLSLSQPFLEEELRTLYKSLEEKEITLRLFPEKLTPIARDLAGFKEKTDANDVRAIYFYLSEFNQRINLKKPNPDFEPTQKIEEGWEWKDQTNSVLNYARAYMKKDKKGNWKKAEYENPDDMIMKFIHDNIDEIRSRMSDTARSVFRLQELKQERKNSDTFGLNAYKDAKPASLYTIAATLLNFDGTKRIRKSTGDIAGWNFINRHVLCNTAYHQRGGVARSNLKHHGAKNYIAKKQDNKLEKINKAGRISKTIKPRKSFDQSEHESFTKYSSEWNSAEKECWKIMKDIIQERD